MGFFTKYIYYCSFCGGIFTLILSIMAFINVEALKIKKDENIHSGVNLIISSAVSQLFKISFSGQSSFLFIFI